MWGCRIGQRAPPSPPPHYSPHANFFLSFAMFKTCHEMLPGKTEGERYILTAFIIWGTPEHV